MIDPLDSFEHNGDGEDEPQGNAYVRPTDPQTSFDAAGSINITDDSALAWGYFLGMYNSFGVTAVEFYMLVWKDLLGKGYSPDEAHRRSESLRRRLQRDLLNARLVTLELDPDWRPSARQPWRKPRYRKRKGQHIYWFRGVWTDGLFHFLD